MLLTDPLDVARPDGLGRSADTTAVEFDAYADRYAELLRDPVRERFDPAGTFFHERKRDVIRSVFQRSGHDTKAMQWLDVGCGQGTLLRVMGEDFATANGCDLSREMLTACDDLAVTWQPSAERLPYDDASFDFVTAICVYHHVPKCERAAFTAELTRVLRPGGVVCVMEHNPWNPVTRLIVARSPVDADAVLLSAGEARRWLRSAGLNAATTEYFLFVPAGWYRRWGWLESGFRGVPLGGQYAVFATPA